MMDQKNSTYADFAEYVRLSDSLYPNRYRLQRTIILIRPSIIRLGLTDLIVSFFEQKNFVMLHRSSSSLADYNTLLLSRLEGVTTDEIEVYKDFMQETHIEAILLTKYGAISEAYELSYGHDAELAKEDQKEVDERKQKILIDPTRSLNYLMKEEIKKNQEMISKLQLMPTKSSHKLKEWENKHIMCQTNEYSINQMICMFSHKFSQISDTIVMINPLYFEKRLELKALLNKRLRFKVINEVEITLDEQMNDIYIRDYCAKYNYENWSDISDYFYQRQTMLLHITKPGGLEELEIIYNRYAKQNENELIKKRSELSPELKLHDIPHYFIPAFTLGARRFAQRILNPNLISFTGDDLVREGIGIERRQQVDRLNYMLETTVGEKMKTAIADANIDEGSQKSWIDQSFIQSTVIPYISEQGYKKKIMCEDEEVSSAVHIAMESQNIGYYELRASRLKDEIGTIYIEDIGTRLKRNFKIKALYYNKVNEISPEHIPAFYQYRFHPKEFKKGEKVDIAFECEEYMGRMFINDIAMTMKKYREAEKTEHFRHLSPEERRGSIVAHLWGQKLGKMCAKLNTLQYDNVRGYGKLVEIKGGAKDNKKYACELDCDISEISEIKLSNIISMADKIEKYFKGSKEHMKFVSKLNEWLDKLWDDEDYAAMWKDPKVYLVPEKLNEFNIRIYAKVTRIANVMRDFDENPVGTVEIRRFNPQFEKVIASFPTNPDMVNARAEPAPESSIFFSRYMAKRTFVPLSTIGTTYQYDFKKKLEFEDKRPNAISVIEKSVYGDQIDQSDRLFKAAYLLVQKKNCSIVNPEILANRTKYYLAGMILWLLSVRLRKLKKYESAFDDKTDYIVCINNVMQGMATYFEKAQGGTFKQAHIQCEYILYGIKMASELIDEINNIRRLLANIREGRTVRRDFSFGEPENNKFLQSSNTLANEEKKAFEKTLQDKYELEVKLRQKEDELDETLVEIAHPSIDKLLVYHENLIHIKRERYYQPAIFEYWEPDINHERYMKTITYGGDTMKLLPKRLQKPNNVSEVQMRWAKTEVMQKTMLRPCPDNKLEEEVTVKKVTTEADKKMKNAIDAIIKRIKEQ